jgi:hypothetical protein
MSEKTEHSPLPWSTGQLDNGRADYIFASGQAIADCEFSSNGMVNEANAAMIVRAVNAHAQIVAALTQIAAIENKDFGPDWEEIEEARAIAEKALASLKEQS